MTDRHDDHDRGFAHDLGVMTRMVARRRALQWFAGAGTAALVTGCGGSGDPTETTSSVGVVTTATVTSTPTATVTATSGTTACIADPAETSGPYPADGTNAASGSTSNILPVTGIVRNDIRSSFIATTTVATGVAVAITLTLVNVNASCSPLSGYAVYLWQCDRSGNYSLYTAPAESYLRGVQVSDAAGQVTFTTIFPGCYSGRYPHLHFEVFSSLAAATGGKYAVLTSQLAMPAAICATVYADSVTYPSSASNFAAVSLTTDMVFADNSAAQIAQQTPGFTGNVAAGYTATALIGIAR